MKGAEARTTIAVDAAAAPDLGAPLFAALEAAFPVAFRPLRTAADEAAAVIATPAAGIGSSSDVRVPTLVLAGRPASVQGSHSFRLRGRDAVDRRLRGFTGRDPLAGPALEALPGEQVLATSRGRPVWTVSPGPAPLHRLAAALPTLGPTDALRDLFADQALGLIALVHLLRSVGSEGPEGRRPGPIRACFLFDDPNLHRPTYGFLDFERLVAHADRHGYHATMAMIPLDRRFPHGSTVELFRRRPDRLALAVHGNNHLSRELLRASSEHEALGLAAQALRRIASFERRSGIRVGRVMVPPHGMCAASVAHALGALRYDALCAIHPYPWTEEPPSAAPLAGWEPAEFASGCAVIPRVHIDSDFEELAIRAFLDQPLVVYGHHNDLAVGLDRLAAVGDRLAGLGEVSWMSLAQIAETNFAGRREGTSLVVRPFSHRLRIDLDDRLESITVLAPRGADGAFAGWSTPAHRNLPFGHPVPAPAGRIELLLDPVEPVDPADVAAPRPSAWPLVRRLATETRDRLEPLLARSP